MELVSQSRKKSIDNKACCNDGVGDGFSQLFSMLKFWEKKTPPSQEKNNENQ